MTTIDPRHVHVLVRSMRLALRVMSGCLTADEDGERTSDFSKPVALRSLEIAFGLTFTTT